MAGESMAENGSAVHRFAGGLFDVGAVQGGGRLGLSRLLAGVLFIKSRNTTSGLASVCYAFLKRRRYG
jgi:hypothetical protein